MTHDHFSPEELTALRELVYGGSVRKGGLPEFVAVFEALVNYGYALLDSAGYYVVTTKGRDYLKLFDMSQSELQQMEEAWNNASPQEKWDALNAVSEAITGEPSPITEAPADFVTVASKPDEITPEHPDFYPSDWITEEDGKIWELEKQVKRLNSEVEAAVNIILAFIRTAEVNEEIAKPALIAKAKRFVTHNLGLPTD